MKTAKSIISKSLFFVVTLSIFGCTTNNNCDPMQNKGIGPVINVELGEINLKMAEDGGKLYNDLCRVCHNEIKQMEGPAHKGIINRRTPEWIMNMMMNPKEMAQNDPIAKILAERVNGVEMVDMNLSELEARKILEYFRTLK
jgi:cytochrome c